MQAFNLFTPYFFPTPAIPLFRPTGKGKFPAFYLASDWLVMAETDPEVEVEVPRIHFEAHADTPDLAVIQMQVFIECACLKFLAWVALQRTTLSAEPTEGEVKQTVCFRNMTISVIGASRGKLYSTHLGDPVVMYDARNQCFKCESDVGFFASDNSLLWVSSSNT